MYFLKIFLFFEFTSTVFLMQKCYNAIRGGVLVSKKPVQIYFDESLHNRIKEAAQANHMTVAGFIRAATLEAVKKYIEGKNRIT